MNGSTHTTSGESGERSHAPLLRHANACGSITSDEATLTICIGDADGDGDTDSDNIIVFFAAWDSGC